jgi:hypothetical protein
VKKKHTPGPWTFDKDNLNIYANGMVAETYGHTHNGERHANARLIAAAPELLEALEALMIEIKLEYGPKEFEALVSSKSKKAVFMAEKAITKAIGW